jgi:para-aminobenzoate synthetase/4-amino-4-deoxychorismate lyase
VTVGSAPAATAGLLPSASTPTARFDDLTSTSGSFVLERATEINAAHHPGEVVPTLQAAERAAQQGAWVAGFVAYEAAAGLDPRLAVTAWSAGHPLADLPLAWFACFDERRAVPAPARPASLPATIRWSFDRDKLWHRTAVQTVRDAIAHGEYYQANLTLRAHTRLGNPMPLYSQLAGRQRAAFHALLDTGDYTIVSASPELFFRRRGGIVTTRPMKGTSRRDRDPRMDLRLASELRGSEKERAENVMIVDLLRNDLAKIAISGGVRVSDLLRVEAYPTVWQLTSTITAHTRADVDLVDLFTALFPSGSVTGAPKQASMAAIAGIEGRPRGVYCGAIGFLSPGTRLPDARFSVAIRTVTVSAGGYAEYGVGGGITYSSDPGAEWLEIAAKTAVLGATRTSTQRQGAETAGMPATDASAD